MSTVIYNGYRLSSEPLYLHQIQDLVDPLRSILFSCAQETIAKQSISSAFGIMDQAVAKAMGYEVKLDQPPSKSSIGVAHSSTRDQIEEDSAKGRSNWLDPEVSLCVFTNDEGTYGLLFTEGKHLRKLFEDVLGAQEFNYWNNTDPDENVPFDLWKKRGQLWDDFLGNSSPAERGATLTLVSKNAIHYAHPILVYPSPGEDEKDIPQDWMPDFDKRMHRLALNMPQAQLPPEQAEEMEKSNSVSIMVRHLRQLEKGEVPQFNELVEQLKKIMPREYTMGQLRMSFEDVEKEFGSKPTRPPRP